MCLGVEQCGRGLEGEMGGVGGTSCPQGNGAEGDTAGEGDMASLARSSMHWTTAVGVVWSLPVASWTAISDVCGVEVGPARRRFRSWMTCFGFFTNRRVMNAP